MKKLKISIKISIITFEVIAFILSIPLVYFLGVYFLINWKEEILKDLKKIDKILNK